MSNQNQTPCTTSTLSHPTAVQKIVSPVAALVTALVNLRERMIVTAYTWQQRVDKRQHLRGLDDQLLSDIGMSRREADREVAKPFWRS